MNFLDLTLCEFPWILVFVCAWSDSVQHDLVSFFGKVIERTVHPRRFMYLEMGVAVGKSLYTQMNIFEATSSIFALDVEDINPTLASMLDRERVVATWTEEELQAGVQTTRRTDVAKAHGHSVDSIQIFSLKGRKGPTLTYLAGDEFNAESWNRLRGLGEPKFQVILSDALHTKEALLMEWKMIRDKRLLDENTFAYVWDNCHSGTLREAFNQIVHQFEAERPDTFFCSTVFSIHGWLGVHEHSHPTCVMTTLDLKEMRSSDALFGAVEVLEPVSCRTGIRSTPMSLEQVRRHNHATRQSVNTWIKRGDWETPPSLFNYGLPASVFHLIDKDVGAIPIQVWMRSCPAVVEPEV